MSDREGPPPIPSRRARTAARVRGMAVDLTPLRVSRDYRLLWFGELVSHTGRHITVVALPYQVFLLTRSPLAVGLIGLVQVIPLVLFSFVGGVIADRVDRRRLMAVAQAGLAVCSVLLALVTLADRTPLWILYVLAAAIGAVSGLDSPTRTATVPRLVGLEHLSSAIALEQTLFQVSDVVGPAIGGLLLAQLGLAWAYGVDALTFVVALVTVLMMRPVPPEPDEERVGGFHSFREGFRYLRRRPVLRSIFYVDLIAMVLAMPRALFPFYAADIFRVGPQGLGLLYAAPGVGALLGALTSGWVHRVRGQGRAVLWSVVLWGVAVAAFGVTSVFWLALVFLAVAGAADVVSAVLRSTILQGTIPDRLRGRLSSIHIAVVVGGPRVGDLRAGAAASLTTPAISAVAGGLACVLGVGVLAALVPRFARYRAGEPP